MAAWKEMAGQRAMPVAPAVRGPSQRFRSPGALAAYSLTGPSNQDATVECADSASEGW